MTWLALVLDACAMLHIADPAAFYALPDATQDLWVDHARNLRSGAYDTRGKAGGRQGGQTHGDAMAIQDAAMRAARKRREVTG